MTNDAAINLAQDALRHQINEKSWDADHAINDYGLKCKLHVEKWLEAIDVLEAMRTHDRRKSLGNSSAVHGQD